tara:strand:+ start:1308 stop:1952 length:645 start_codon:yes stop_codon:yes gene_type:complete
MEDEIVHNFCESRLNNNEPPEYFNSFTSLFITIIPLILGFPKNNIFYNVACMLAFNGCASFYYHYRLTWIGKQSDEISMILANYYGIWGLLKMYHYSKKDKLNWYNGWNSMFMVCFIVSNTLLRFDYLFPYIFSIYISISLFYIREVALRHGIVYRKYLLISFTGALCWIISELNCNEFTVYGHVLWHLLFPLGFYQLVLRYDEKITELRQILY